MSTIEEPDQGKQGESEQHSPLAFARATGFVLQGAGAALVVAGICFWIVSGFIVDPVSEPPQRWSEHLEGARLPSALATIGIVVSIVGGLAIGVVGVGLHQDRPRSAIWATLLSAALSLVFLSLGATLFVVCREWVMGAIAVILAVCCAMMFMLAGQSAGLHRAHPPDAHNIVTDEELEAMKSARRH